MSDVTEDAQRKRTALRALDKLQASLRERKVDVTRWAQELKDERQAAARQTPSKSQ